MTDSARSDAVPGGAPRIETQDAEPGDRPAVKEDRSGVDVPDTARGDADDAPTSPVEPA